MSLFRILVLSLAVVPLAPASQDSVSLARVTQMNGDCLAAGGVPWYFHTHFFPESKKERITLKSKGTSKWETTSQFSSGTTSFAFYGKESLLLGSENELYVGTYLESRGYVSLKSVGDFPRIRAKSCELKYDGFGNVDLEKSVCSELVLRGEDAPETMAFYNVKTGAPTDFSVSVLRVKDCLRKALEK